ncbi:hypothetical protein [Litoribacillus peritrichatus]|uniref:Oxidoreductase n=1 Tax=Litoribacillus peritrichatus TaxID=718191 RepID=A0ABP7M7B1_9GAMM
MTQKCAVIFGATGLTGSALLNELLLSPHYLRVYAFTRSPILTEHAKLEVFEQPLDAINNETISLLPNEMDVFFCLGTTLAKAGSKDMFKKVDYYLPLKLVNMFARKADHFLIISSLGAQPDSLSFYLSVKGQLEVDLKVLDIERLTIFRPSLLVGDRKEKRFKEDFSSTLSKLVNPLFSFKVLKKYKPTDCEDLAKAMCLVATTGKGLGNARTNVISSDMIADLINS